MLVKAPPTPDRDKSKVLLVDPTIWPEYRKPDCDLRPVYQELTAAVASFGVEHRLLTEKHAPLDIWIRDWGFVEGHYFRFKPSYAKKLYPQAAVQKARKHLDQLLGCDHPTVPLILDGGNLVHNGKIAVLTEKVLRDNRQLARREVEAIIISLGFERVVFIPTEPEDTIGHADGILRFISPDVLLVNDYTGRDFSSYRRRLRKCLERARIDAEIIPLPWFSTDEINDGIWSAVGCYINFILTAQGVVLPTFQHSLDDRAAAVLANHTTLPIRQVFATALARLGGVLNCISLTC